MDKDFIQSLSAQKEESNCCRKFYAEYAPALGIPNRFTYLKEDGSECSIHNPLLKTKEEQCQP